MLSTTTQATYNYDPVTVLLIAGIVALVLTVWQSRWNPLYMFFTIIHELGHGLVAMLTGGDFRKFELKDEGPSTGTATYSGGCNFFIIQAGYLSEAAVSALLIILGSMPENAGLAVIIIGALLILFTIIYGWSGGCLTLLVGVFWGLAFIFAGMQNNPVWAVFILNLMGIYGVISTFKGLKSAYRGDASAMKKEVGCSPIFWMIVWGGLSTVCIFGAIWVSWFRQ